MALGGEKDTAGDRWRQGGFEVSEGIAVEPDRGGLSETDQALEGAEIVLQGLGRMVGGDQAAALLLALDPVGFDLVVEGKRPVGEHGSCFESGHKGLLGAVAPEGKQPPGERGIRSGADVDRAAGPQHPAEGRPDKAGPGKRIGQGGHDPARVAVGSPLPRDPGIEDGNVPAALAQLAGGAQPDNARSNDDDMGHDPLFLRAAYPDRNPPRD